MAETLATSAPTPAPIDPTPQADQVAGSKVERLALLSEFRWINYPRAREIRSELERLLREERRQRPGCRLITGPSNNGKSRLVDRFAADHRAVASPDGRGLQCPVLAIQAPPQPRIGLLCETLLEAVHAPRPKRQSRDRLLLQVRVVLGNVGVKMLVIDEIHHILNGSTQEQNALLATLKWLSNELRVSIVGAGTADAARAISMDPQLANRFEPWPLPRWREGVELRRLLASLEEQLPLSEPSHLQRGELPRLILNLSEGTLGEILEVVRTAAQRAIDDGVGRITYDLLTQMAWIPPSKRRKAAEEL